MSLKTLKALLISYHCILTVLVPFMNFGNGKQMNPLQMAVGRSPSAVRDLFPTQLHGVLFSNLSSRVRSPDDEVRGRLIVRGSACETNRV